MKAQSRSSKDDRDSVEFLKQAHSLENRYTKPRTDKLETNGAVVMIS